MVEGKACTPKQPICTETMPSDGSCADECCKAHDRCCGSADRTPCNDAIIRCLKDCRHGSAKSCHRGMVPVPVDVILAGSTAFEDLEPGRRCAPLSLRVPVVAVELDPYGCCGTSCDGSLRSHAPTGQAALAGMVEEDKA